jgi:hypothetical protein
MSDSYMEDGFSDSADDEAIRKIYQELMSKMAQNRSRAGQGQKRAAPTETGKRSAEGSNGGDGVASGSGSGGTPQTQEG